MYLGSQSLALYLFLASNSILTIIALHSSQLPDVFLSGILNSNFIASCMQRSVEKEESAYSLFVPKGIAVITLLCNGMRIMGCGSLLCQSVVAQI